MPCMKRMSVSKSHVEPSLPWAVPRISHAPSTPLKSVIVPISSWGPRPGARTWMNGSLGTGLNVGSSPPAIGVGAPCRRASASAGSRRLTPASPPPATPPLTSTCRRERRSISPGLLGIGPHDPTPVGTIQATAGSAAARVTLNHLTELVEQPLHRALGLTDWEAGRIRDLLGRDPNHFD